jgi:protein subunit release factor B
VSAFPVSLEKETQLAQRMVALGVTEGDIEESFVRSGGHGGQNVNKTSTCVMLLHRPTGLQVKCQQTRQQGLNRFIARQLLLTKIATDRETRAAAERQLVEKLRRQKRKRPRGVKEQILRTKSRQSEKKANRRYRPAAD